MDKFEYNPRCGDGETKSGEWWTEAQDVALNGVPAYCQLFFAELFNEFPVLAHNVIFSRWSVQPDWIYAEFNVFDSDFGLQIDTDEGCEYIVVWGPNGRAPSRPPGRWPGGA